jgi:hypothetical protein
MLVCSLQSVFLATMCPNVVETVRLSAYDEVSEV